MPADPKEPDIEEIKREAMEGNEGRAVNRVGALYARIIKLFEDSTALPDREFREDSVGYQADFATWGRNYTRGQRPDIQTDQLKRSPELIIRPIGSRTQALAALRAVAEQGEGASMNDQPDPDAEISHFQRFLEIYRAFSKVKQPPVKAVPVNPATMPAATGELIEREPALITHPTSLAWAQLFNTRYRMLLNLLMHPLHIEDSVQTMAGALSARGRLIVAAFGEMYHLRALANIVTRQPLAEARPESLRSAFRASVQARFAGPGAEPLVGERLLRVGDAAFALDPLSSQGVQHALSSAGQAAIVIHTILARPENATWAKAFFRERHHEMIDRHRASCAALYSRQNRFETPFWQERKRLASAVLSPTPSKDKGTFGRAGLDASSGFRVGTVFETFALKEATNLSGGDPRGFFGGLLAGARNVRCHYYVRSFQQARVRRDRLFGKHVEARTPEVAAIQRVANGVVIDERATRTVDQHRPRRHHGELLRADHGPGFGRSARVQANDA
jgi:Ferritin-like/Tryptophan halogenase